MSFSASRTGLLFECQYSFRPDVQGPPEDESEKAAYGTRVHELAEQIAKGKWENVRRLAEEYAKLGT